MSAEDDLRVNTLHRFAKRSPNLLLQEYSHCEVPAGCGGVVLRWLEPEHGVPVLVQVGADAKSEAWLDGVALAGSRAMLGLGRHVVAVHLQALERPQKAKAGWLKTQWDALQWQRVRLPLSVGVVSETSGAPADLLRTASDVTWRRTEQAPGAQWVEPAFDTAGGGWQATDPLSEDELTNNPLRDNYQIRRAIGMQQPIMGISSFESWIRIEFTMTLEQVAPRETTTP